MKSLYTGTSWSTRGKGDTLVLYRGTPIGFVSIPVKETRKLADRGIAYTLTATCYGTLDDYPDVKELKYSRPPYVFADDIIEELDIRDAGVPSEAEKVEFNVFDEIRLSSVISRKAWRYPGAGLETIQPTDKSKAKPGIRLVTKTGKTIVELRARDRCYPELVRLAQGKKTFFITARRIQNRGPEDKPYHFTIWHW